MRMSSSGFPSSRGGEFDGTSGSCGLVEGKTSNGANSELEGTIEGVRCRSTALPTDWANAAEQQKKLQNSKPRTQIFCLIFCI
jgi:hypothetical protein